MKIFGVILTVLVSGPFMTASATTMDFKNFIFPELKTDRAELASSFHIQRRIVVAEGKIVRDDIKQSDIIYSEEELPKSYCVLDVQYQISKGDLPSGPIVIPSAQYDLKAKMENGSLDMGPIVPDSKDPVEVYVSYAYRSLKNAYDFPKVPSKIMGHEATFMLVSVQCKDTILPDDIKNTTNPSVVAKSFGALAHVD